MLRTILCLRAMLMVLCALLLMASQCPKDAAVCGISFPLRTSDVHYIPDTPSKVIVIALDTAPTMASSVFETTLKELGYEYYLLGTTPENPQPARNGVFKFALWNYRFWRYAGVVESIVKTQPEKIVVFSDANDVLFTSGPDEIAKKFKQQSNKILLSGTMYCCNVNIIEYVRKEAQRVGIVDIESTNPEIKFAVGILPFSIFFNGPHFGLGEQPGFLWTPGAMEEVAAIKSIGSIDSTFVTKNRYINAGGIVGYAKDILSAMTEINSKPFDDDEQQWSLWLGKKGFPGGIAGVDYQQSIFAVVDQMEGRDSEVRVLYDDWSPLPSSKFFDFQFDADEGRFVNSDLQSPVAFHCAGCSSSKMHNYRKWLLEKLPSVWEKLSPNQQQFIEKC